MQIHWFNPENDLALAANTPTYTPPRGPLKLQRAGAALPLWYGDAGDKVLCYGVNAAWLRQKCEDFAIDTHLFDHEPTADTIPSPWGWSAYARRHFLDEGFDPKVLPSPEEIETMRMLSHRRTGARVGALLAEAVPQIAIAPPAYDAYTVDDAERWLAAHPQAYVKMPWSSSGRGVVDTRTASRATVMGLVDDSVRRQGSVMLEIAYDRAIDFARLFECTGGQCRQIGTSVFTVDHRCGYTGNLLASEPARLQAIGVHYPLERVLTVSEALRGIMEQEIAPHYSGVVGVDMLISTDGILDAVVEINLRKTMGYVALRFADRYLHPDAATGTFQVLRSSEAPAESYTCSDGRLLRGTLLLTPPNHDFAFVAQVEP